MKQKTVKILLCCLAVKAMHVIFNSIADPIWTIKRSRNKSVSTKLSSSFKNQTTTQFNLDISHHVPSSLGKFITKSAKGWINLDKICEVKPDFKLVNLTSPANTYIYVYEKRDDIWVSDHVINKGTWEENHVKRLCNLLKTDKELVFIDIGANIGVFTLAAAKTGRHVYAVDCLKSNVMRLCASVTRGRLVDDVTIVYNALSNVRGNVSLKTKEKNKGGTRIKQSDDSSPGVSSGVVSAILLDDLLDVIKAKKAIMKMDVESFENKVLEGGEQIFTQIQVQYLLLEFRFHSGKESGKFIVDFLDRHGLEPYTVPYRPSVKLNPNDTRKWPEDVLFKRKGIVKT